MHHLRPVRTSRLLLPKYGALNIVPLSGPKVPVSRPARPSYPLGDGRRVVWMSRQIVHVPVHYRLGRWLSRHYRRYVVRHIRTSQSSAAA